MNTSRVFLEIGEKILQLVDVNIASFHPNSNAINVWNLSLSVLLSSKSEKKFGYFKHRVVDIEFVTFLVFCVLRCHRGQMICNWQPINQTITSFVSRVVNFYTFRFFVSLNALWLICQPKSCNGKLWYMKIKRPIFFSKGFFIQVLYGSSVFNAFPLNSCKTCNVHDNWHLHVLIDTL